MDFSENIITYYTSESRHAFYNGLITGVVMFIVGLLLCLRSDGYSLSRGVSTILLLGGMLASVGGYVSYSKAKSELPIKLELYKSEQREFIDVEVRKVDAIHKAWPGIKLFWTAFIVLGIVLIFVTTKLFWSGLAIGSLLLGTIGHYEELRSMRHNELYYHEVMELLRTQ